MNYAVKLSIRIHYAPTILILSICLRETHTYVSKGTYTKEIITTLFTGAGSWSKSTYSSLGK